MYVKTRLCSIFIWQPWINGDHFAGTVLKTVFADGIKAHDSYNGSDGRTMALIWEKTNVTRKMHVACVAFGTTSFRVRLQAVTKLVNNPVKELFWAEDVFVKERLPRVLCIVNTWVEMSFFNMTFSFLINEHTISGNCAGAQHFRLCLQLVPSNSSRLGSPVYPLPLVFPRKGKEHRFTTRPACN